MPKSFTIKADQDTYVEVVPHGDGTFWLGIQQPRASLGTTVGVAAENALRTFLNKRHNKTLKKSKRPAKKKVHIVFQFQPGPNDLSLEAVFETKAAAEKYVLEAPPLAFRQEYVIQEHVVR